MRRVLGTGLAAIMALGILGAPPANATHCGPANITSCPNPVTMVVFEGIGNVCSKALVLNPLLYGTKCTYVTSDPVWNATKAISTWNQAGYADGSKYQGLFWPGVGPGAIGPYRINISSAVSPPGNVCVDSIGGAGCKTESEGKLLPGNAAGTTTLGAYCGGSQGRGQFKFTASVPGTINEGTIGWDHSVATILPTYGTVLRLNGVTLPTNARPSVRGFNSSRGIGGSGNCGVDTPTTGFQVEGFTITF